MSNKNVPNGVFHKCSVTSGSRCRSEAGASRRNLKLEIEYDGTNYCGWQVQIRQRRKKSIQEILEKTLRKILQQKVKLISSGRTDSGVHAASQVVNFKTNSKIPLYNLQKALNTLLPDDIIVKGVKEVRPDFHARFCAKSKLYRYSILNRTYPSAILRQYAYFYPYRLDIDLMRKEAKYLVGKHNFQSFCASDKEEKNHVRTIKYIGIKKDGDLISIDIEANGFLYNMVRNIVGTLLEIGRGKLSKGSMQHILLLKDRKKAGPTAPSHGLCLMKVNY